MLYVMRSGWSLQLPPLDSLDMMVLARTLSKLRAVHSLRKIWFEFFRCAVHELDGQLAQ